MFNYIFDLDWALYSEKDVDDSTDTKYYKSFERKPLLNKLLKSLNGNKYIFSNGNKEHVDEVMDKMKLKSFFKNTANSDEYPNNLKPDILAYNYVIDKFNLDQTKPTLFFEDTIENLETAKKLGWITILIGDKFYKNYSYVAHIFPTIEKALIFLTSKPYRKSLKL